MNVDLNASFADARVHSETMPINRNSPIPLHHQVRNYLLSCLENGELQPGQQLLHEREYATRFGLSLAPIRQAILDLVKEGYLYRVPGRGTFVHEEKVEEKISILSSFSESMQAKGLNVVLHVIKLSLDKAPSHLRTVCGLENQQVVSLQRVAFVENKAIALLISYLPAQLVPGLETQDLNGQSLYKVIEERYGIVLVRAENTIEVVRCPAAQAILLNIPSGTPMLQVEGKTYDVKDQFVEFAQVLYRTDRFRFTIESFRRDDRVLHLIGTPEKPDKKEDASHD